MKKILYLILVLAFVSCNEKEFFESIVPKEVDEYSRKFISDVQTHHVDTCMNYIAEEMQTEEGITFMTNVANGIREFKFDSLRMVNATYTKMFGETPVVNYIIEYEQEMEEGSVYFFFNIIEQNNKFTINGFDARRLEIPLSEINSFSLKDKPLFNYIFLTIGVLLFFFVVTTLIVAIKTPLNRKWLWIIGILISFIKFKLNWATGAFDFQIISFQLFGLGFTKSGMYAPWILSFSLPIVSMLFWMKRSKDKSKKEQEEKMQAIIANYQEEKKNEENSNN